MEERMESEPDGEMRCPWCKTRGFGGAVCPECGGSAEPVALRGSAPSGEPEWERRYREADAEVRRLKDCRAHDALKIDALNKRSERLPRGYVVLIRDARKGAGWRLLDTTLWLRLADAYDYASAAREKADWVIVPVGWPLEPREGSAS